MSCRKTTTRKKVVLKPMEVVTPGFKIKTDAHRMYALDQVVIHTARMRIQKPNVFII
jgi:hypothetical protein